MHIAPGQGLTTPRGRNFDVYRNILSRQSFVASLKKSLWSLILYIFFMILHMYIAPGQRHTAQGDKVLMSREMSCHFIHLLQVSKIVFEAWFYIFFSWVNTCILARDRGTQPQRDKTVNRKALSLYPFVASFKEISLKSDFIHFLFQI